MVGSFAGKWDKPGRGSNFLSSRGGGERDGGVWGSVGLNVERKGTFLRALSSKRNDQG